MELFNKEDKMQTEIKTITINGVEYVERSAQNTLAKTLDGKKYVIVRTYSAGVFAGYIDSRNGQEVVMINSRRIWYWDGAASLSQLAVDGPSKPQNCKFAKPVPRVELLNAIEILDVTDKAKKVIDGVKEWEA